MLQDPRCHRTSKVSRDPEFAAKVKEVAGLYLNPPDNALVLSVDEKASIGGALGIELITAYAKSGHVDLLAIPRQGL